MASAEHLLHEAQYAFASITFGESSENQRNRSRASSLCKKIMRKYPGTMEAGEALAILRRLGEEAFTSNLAVAHQHTSQVSRSKRSETTVPPEVRTFVTDVSDDTILNWAGLIHLIVRAPKLVLAILAGGGLFLFGILGPVIFLPFVLFIVLTGPGRSLLNPQQRDKVDSLVVEINRWIAEQNR